ncbi:MAG TPA: glutamine-hydrolyzing GMP synthase [Ignavibacteria bacterium]
MKKTDLILILDFGSQYTQLIARRTREKKVYSEIQPYNIDIKSYLQEKTSFPDQKIAQRVPGSKEEGKAGYELKGVILSGGPSSVLDKDSPILSEDNYNFLIKNNIPILGICYGLQLLTYLNGGKIHKSNVREYGHTRIKVIKTNSVLLKGTGKTFSVWMSHGDSIDRLPEDFQPTSKSTNNILSSFESTQRKLYGLQFHPEVMHTENGKKILDNYLFNVCKVKNLFRAESFIKSKIVEIREKVRDGYAICALSGGVDSSVAAILVQKAIGKKLICIHIDNGLMRKDESKKVISLFKKSFNLNLKFVDAGKLFLKRLNKITDPEKKRKIIGKTFIEVFEKEAEKLEKKNKKIKYLIQGTLYPDVIESVSFKGPSVTIKSHHNVGGLPEKMNLKLIEPFRELFKDEVREIGKKLKLTLNFINRHPFPGPGLAVRILGDITKERLNILREVDDIYMSELKHFDLYNSIWQAFAVLLPVKTVGVMGDERSYENVIALRAVTSTDGMTADFYGFEKDFLTGVSNKIINGVKGVNRVVYDISSKPPATIEWE